MKRTPSILAAVALAALIAGCASARRLPQEEGLHPRLTPFTYIEEGKLVAFSVDTQCTALRDKEPFVPLPVAVANKGLDKLVMTRESFTLVDEAGNRYPLATVQEARTLGPLMNNDYRVSEYFFDVIATQFHAWRFQSVTLFPVLNAANPLLGSRRNIVADSIELGKRMWMADILYFPHPKDSLKGKKFELWLSTPDLAEPVFVKFRIK